MDWIATLCPHNALRRPDFRWHSAQRLVEGLLFPAEWVDEWILLGVRLLKPDWKPTDRPSSRDLTHLATARWLAEQAPEWDRVEVEARILARQSPAIIGQKVGLAPEAIEAYERMFFAVNDRLSAMSYIVHHALHLHEEIAERDVGVHVRWYGYFAGPVVLECVLDAVGPVGGREYAIDLPSKELCRLRKKLRLAIKLRMTPVTPANAVKFLKLHLLQLELELKTKRRGKMR